MAISTYQQAKRLSTINDKTEVDRECLNRNNDVSQKVYVYNMMNRWVCMNIAHRTRALAWLRHVKYRNLPGSSEGAEYKIQTINERRRKAVSRRCTHQLQQRDGKSRTKRSAMDEHCIALCGQLNKQTTAVHGYSREVPINLFPHVSSVHHHHQQHRHRDSDQMNPDRHEFENRLFIPALLVHL